MVQARGRALQGLRDMAVLAIEGHKKLEAAQQELYDAFSACFKTVPRHGGNRLKKWRYVAISGLYMLVTG